jgi:peptidoglycan/xylan/chitin deacetylase (PgdA/CDA1 family)
LFYVKKIISATAVLLLVAGLAGCGPVVKADSNIETSQTIIPYNEVVGLPPLTESKTGIVFNSGVEIMMSSVYAGAQPVPILMYHYIREMPPEDDVLGRGLTVTPASFDRQINFLKSAGYEAIDFNQMRDSTLPSKPVIITFDDGYSDAYATAMPALQKYGYKGVFYIITQNVGKESFLTWSQIKEISDRGMVIGSHTISHPNLAAENMSPEKVRRELIDSKKIIESYTGKVVNDLCYPSGKYNDVVEKVAAEAGYKTATTTHIDVAHSGDQWLALPRLRIKDDSDLAKLLN